MGLRFLAENETRPVVYFTQSNGELSLGGGLGIEASPSASQLQRYLETNYSVDVKPLTFPDSGANAQIPADAGVVVEVAGLVDGLAVISQASFDIFGNVA